MARMAPQVTIPDYYSRLVDPFVALARALAVSTWLRLGTGITLVPQRNPLLLKAFLKPMVPRPSPPGNPCGYPPIS